MLHEDYPHLLQEGRIRDLVMKNRIVQPSMCDNMSDRSGGVTDQKIAYFRRRAQGGVGWINLGYAYVTGRGRGCTYFQVGVYDDALIAGLRRLTDDVHKYDVRMGCQIAHAGRQTTHHYIHGLTPEAPSAVAEHVLGEVPEEMSLERIHEVQQDYAKAAVRAREAGFDLVELHGAHGYLFHSFISPLGNHRTDEYGGSLENRMRFSLETVRAVRQAIGDDFPLGYRISGDEFMEGGFTLDDTLAVVAALEREGIDYVHVSAGSYESFHMMIAPMGIGPGQLEHLAAAVKERVSIPVVSVGRYDTPALADRVLADGHADFVSMGRALIADPDLPRKAIERRPDDVRPCIACDQGCIDRWVAALDITCVGNPETGRELLPGWETPTLASSPSGKAVLVIGGGPAGLEAARVAALAGHRVTIWEQDGALGGQLALAGKPEKSREWGSLVAWLTDQVRQLGVDVQLEQRATAEEVLELTADAVIVATGSRPLMPRSMPGWNLPHVIDPLEALRTEPRSGSRVVVDGGDLIGCQVALWCAEHGCRVTLLGRGRTDLFDDGIGEFAMDMIGEIRRPEVLKDLERASIDLQPKRGIKRIASDGMYGLLVTVDSAGAFAPHTAALRIGPVDEQLLPADTVVIGVKRRPVDDLYDALCGEVGGLYIAGDAIEPRTVEEAIAEGSAAGRSIGGGGVSTSMDPKEAVAAS